MTIYTSSREDILSMHKTGAQAVYDRLTPLFVSQTKFSCSVIP